MAIPNLLDKLNNKAYIKVIFLLILGLLSWKMNTNKIDFSMAIHHDESKKVGFLINNSQDFMHPILMLQSVRLVNPDVKGEKNWHKVVLKGRYVSAAFGTIAMMLFFLFLSFLIGNGGAFLIVMATAMSPMVVLHAHYLKEDIYLLCGLMATMLCHNLWVEKKKLVFLGLFGLAVGLAISAHYKGFTYSLIVLIMTLWVGRTFIAKYILGAIVVAIIGLGVFAIVNNPLFNDWEVFEKGFTFEKNHALDGHTVKLWPTAWWFTFHLRKSIFLGMGMVPALLGIAGLIWTILIWRTLKFGERLLTVFTVVMYFIVELSPLKPHPGYIRYALPVVPGLFYFNYKLFSFIAEKIKIRKFWIGFPMLFVLAVQVNLSLKRLDEIRPDTRVLAEEKFEASGKKVLFEHYTNDDSKGIWSVGRLEPDTVSGKPYELFVMSNFIYDRYRLGANLPGQTHELYKIAELYKELWKLPYEEVRTDLGPFGFHNPIIRFVNVEGIDLKKLYKETRKRGLAKYELIGDKK